MITEKESLTPFLKVINYTDHEEFIVDEMKSFSSVEWFKKQKGSFGKYFNAPFAEMLTERGFAFTFNVLSFDKLMNTRT